MRCTSPAPRRAAAAPRCWGGNLRTQTRWGGNLDLVVTWVWTTTGNLCGRFAVGG